MKSLRETIFDLRNEIGMIVYRDYKTRDYIKITADNLDDYNAIEIRRNDMFLDIEVFVTKKEN